MPSLLHFPAVVILPWLACFALMALVLFLERRAAGRSFELDQEPNERVGDGRRVGKAHS